MLTLAVTVLLFAHAAQAAPRVQAKIDRYRAQTHRCQTQLGLRLTPVGDRHPQGRLYRQWVAALWKARAQAYCSLARTLQNPEAAIRAVFQERAAEALAVARCESGLSTNAENGQYRGLYQMGSSERATYGHGDTALEQTRAAHRYFLATGKTWRPWQCRPDGSLAW